MFDTVMQGFEDARLKIKGQSRLTEDNIAPALESIKKSLLDADVDFKVTKSFLENIKEKCLGDVVHLKSKSGQKVSASDHFVKICHDELVSFLGGEPVKIIKNEKGPTVILLVGLQGAGKTTHAAKLALLLKTQHKMRPLLVAGDVYRPAARDQLKILGEKIDVPVFTLDTPNAVEIAQKGVEFARSEWRDVVIVDTAGRLAIDNTLMSELEDIKAAVHPQNTLLVMDAMIGQDAVRTAGAFDSRLNLTGVVLTKLDGDTRGGAALSVKKVTGKSILFVGTGEALEKMEEFRPEGMASRILGMGDVVGLMSDFERVMDEETAAKKASQIMDGHFDFNDFLEMVGTIGKMGSVKDLMAKAPAGLSGADMNKVSDKDIQRKGAVVQSMTAYERTHPDVLVIQKSPTARSRIARIAKGSAHSEKDVKEVIDQFFQMKQMTQMMSGFGLGLGGGGDGFLSKIPGLGQLNQMAKMAKMAKAMGGGMGGLGGMAGMADLFGGMGGGAGASMPGMGGGFKPADLAEINRMKKRKKEEKMRKQKKR